MSSEEGRGEVARMRVQAIAGFLYGAGITDELIEHVPADGAAAVADSCEE